jgi:hypothetical protein
VIYIEPDLDRGDQQSSAPGDVAHVVGVAEVAGVGDLIDRGAASPVDGVAESPAATPLAGEGAR